MIDTPNTPTRPQDMVVSEEALALVPRETAERLRLCPVAYSETRGVRTLTVATANPHDLAVFDQLQQLTGCRILPAPALETDVRRAIEAHYGNLLTGPRDLLHEMAGIRTNGTPAAAPAQVGEPRGVAAMLEQILQRAITERATDVHLEPHPTVVYVRMRVDGVLYDNTTYEPAAHAAMVSRVKILAKLDIAQSRAPQDGRFDMALGQNAFDVRVSVVPAVDGEKAVMRLLPKSGSALDFDALGLAGRGRELLASLIARPYGMVIVSGPTGCGKTTTLYAALSTIDCVARNVITIEDPVEYQLARITQLQVNPKAGVTFAGGLRAMLRQDPDIIMVGEIRDPETLQMAIQSSLTGHLVLSTLHCNDAAAGASRMIDMGAEPFLIASGVAGIVAQRLVRKICPSCKKPATVHPVMREKLALPNDNATYYTGAGCAQCRQTGYLGRVGLFEVVPLLEPIQHAIITRANAGDIREIARQHGIPTLRDDGIAKAAAGVTSLEEVMRAVYVEVE